MFLSLGNKFASKSQMSIPVQHYLVPEQVRGIQKDLSCTVTLESGEDADDWFVESMQRLLKINEWGKRCPDMNLLFSLTDSNGKNTSRRAHGGDNIKIQNISTNGNETCWMKIEAIEYDDFPDEDKETIAIHFQPGDDPKQHNAYNEGFINKDASCTFVIERSGKDITSIYHSRNDVSNNNKTGPLASWFSIKDEQWNKFLKCMID